MTVGRGRKGSFLSIMSTIQNSSRIPAIDLIRCVCILYIVGFWHLFNYTGAFPGYHNAITYRLTVIALGLYVMISGYLVREKAGPITKKYVLGFYKSRLLKIYPPYILAIIFFYIVKQSDTVTLAKAAFLISMFFKPAPPTLWFITMIIVFFIGAPLLITISTNIRRFIITCTVIIISLSICTAIFRTVDKRIVMYFAPFAVGILMAEHKILFKRLNTLILVAILAVSVLLSPRSSVQIDQSIISIPLALVGPMLIFVVAMRYDKVIWRHNVINNISYASFFMYLFHRPIFKLLKELYFPVSGFYQVIYLLTVCLPFIVAISWLAQKGYDRLIGPIRTSLRFCPAGLQEENAALDDRKLSRHHPG